MVTHNIWPELTDENSYPKSGRATEEIMAQVIDSWAQVDGGVRYEVEVDGRTVTIDEDAEGNWSGFVRGAADNDRKLLKEAFVAVRSLSDDDE